MKSGALLAFQVLFIKTLKERQPKLQDCIMAIEVSFFFAVGYCHRQQGDIVHYDRKKTVPYFPPFEKQIARVMKFCLFTRFL